MKLSQIGSNQTEITTAKGNRVLYSYETPVAAWTEQGAFRTSTKYSVTTSKHPGPPLTTPPIAPNRGDITR